MLSKKLYKYIAQITVLGILIVLLIIGSLYDEAISSKLYAGDNVLSVMVEALGKMPLFIAVAVACCICFYCAKDKSNKKLSLCLQIIYVAGGVLSGILMLMDLFQLITEDSLTSAAMAAMGSVAFFTALTIFIPRLGRAKLQRYKKWALITIVAGAIIVVLTALVKEVWGRFRPYEVADGMPYSNWFSPGSGDGESFFSGHAACGMGIMMFAPLLVINDSEPIKRIIYYILSALFITMTLLGRMMCGAHYLTDVAAGAIISLIIASVSYDVAFEKGGYMLNPDGKINLYL